MIYLSFIGNHDKIDPDSKDCGAVITIFKKYSKLIDEVYLFASPDKKFDKISYKSIALDNKSIIEQLKPAAKVNIIQVDISNPIDYDLVYPVLLDKIQELNADQNFNESEKIINITSGTPTMAACWLLLSQSGIIKNTKLVQSFESKFIKGKESNVNEVNLNIDDFPKIQAPSALKRQLTIVNRENQILSKKLQNQEIVNLLPGLIGKSDQIKEIKEQIIYDINKYTSVLILGERGTGKQVVANSIWSLYRRETDDKLLTLDCGTLPRELIVSELFGYKKGAFTGAEKDSPGLILQAENRMLFLDEIGNLPIEGQNTLLRFLNDGEVRKLGSGEVVNVNAQIIAATNKNVDDSTLFAQDLKDRFDEIIQIPPLRERKADIPILIDHFIGIYSKLEEHLSPIILSDEIISTLMDHNWPGNTRELEKWIKRLSRRFTGGKINKINLPERFISEFLKEDELDLNIPELPLRVSLEEYIEEIREKARTMSNGNMSEVDRLLKQSPGTEKQRKYRNRKNN